MKLPPKIKMTLDKGDGIGKRDWTKKILKNTKYQNTFKNRIELTIAEGDRILFSFTGGQIVAKKYLIFFGKYLPNVTSPLETL